MSLAGALNGNGSKGDSEQGPSINSDETGGKRFESFFLLFECEYRKEIRRGMQMVVGAGPERTNDQPGNELDFIVILELEMAVGPIRNEMVGGARGGTK